MLPTNLFRTLKLLEQFFVVVFQTFIFFMKFIAISEVHLVTFKLELEMLVPLLQKSKFTALGCPEFLHTASVAASIEASTFIIYASIMLE